MIKYRFDEQTIKELLELKWWNLDMKDLVDIDFTNVKECIKILKNKTIKDKTC